MYYPKETMGNKNYYKAKNYSFYSFHLFFSFQLRRLSWYGFTIYLHINTRIYTNIIRLVIKHQACAEPIVCIDLDSTSCQNGVLPEVEKIKVFNESQLETPPREYNNFTLE